MLFLVALVALSDYDRTSQSKLALNKIKESLEMLTTIAKDDAIHDKPIIILFNKTDVFEEKIKTVSLKALDPACPADVEHDFEKGKKFIGRKFLDGESLERLMLVF